MDIRKLQRAIVDGLEDVKAQNIVVFNTEHLSPLFERVIVASGTSNRQTKALAASVRDAVKASGMQVLRTEGEDNGEWIIVDCGAAVAHIMQPGIREYYHLEEIWGGKAVRVKVESKRKGLPQASEPDDEDEADEAPASKAAAKKAPAKKAAAKKVPAKKAAAKSAFARQEADPASRPAAKKAAAKKAPVKKAAAPASPERVQKVVVNAPAAKKVAAKKVAATKVPAKKVAAKAPARKVAAKAPAKKAAAKKTASPRG
ncbi:MAG: ribosome silencing factor [Aquincola sp.]|nr:ribosome silencing factor [Aquincola sp.]